MDGSERRKQSRKLEEKKGKIIRTGECGLGLGRGEEEEEKRTRERMWIGLGTEKGCRRW